MGGDPRSLLEAGEAMRFETELRDGGHLGLTDGRLLLVRDGTTSVPFENVKEIQIQSFDWFLAILSAGLVGFGLLSIPRHVLGGIAFALAGLASLYLTYRKRGRVAVRLHTRADPVTFHLSETATFEEAWERGMAGFEATRDG